MNLYYVDKLIAGVHEHVGLISWKIHNIIEIKTNFFFSPPNIFIHKPGEKFETKQEKNSHIEEY